MLPHTFSWTTSDGSGLDSDTKNQTGLGPGTYLVTVTDAEGNYSTSKSFTINEPDELKVSIESFVNADCNGGSTGSVDVSIIGGVLPYSYSWSNGYTSKDAQNLSSGSYTLTVTDANGCEVEVSQSIDNSNSRPVSDSWVKLEDKFSEGVDQNSNDIFAIDFISDNDGIVVGEYGPFGTGNIGTRIKMVIMVILFMRQMMAEIN